MNQLEYSLEYAPEIDPAINRACASFLAQVRALASVDGVAVVPLGGAQVIANCEKLPAKARELDIPVSWTSCFPGWAGWPAWTRSSTL